MRVLPTLQKQRHPLASGPAQRRRLAQVPVARSFEAALDDAGLHPLAATGLEVLQVNVGTQVQPDLPPLPRGRRARSHRR